MWREHVVWVGPPEMAANGGFTPYINQIGDDPLPLVLSPSPCVYRARATDALDDMGLPWQVGYTSPSFSGVRAAVKAGLGLTVLPQKMVPDDLIALNSADGWPTLSDAEICLLARPDTARDPVIDALSKFIRDRLDYNRHLNL
jgi:DNA-binding transcriptional LysR family regulator